MIKSKSNSSQVEWAPAHFSWTLIDYKKISIKMEEIPPEGKSAPHFHRGSSQFFFILEGKAELRKEDSTFILKKDEGIEVTSGERHQILNLGKKNLLFLLVSYPRIP